VADILDESCQEERRSKLTTAECARILGMTSEFVRGEIIEGRLRARVFKPAGRRRAKYVIESPDLEAYQREYWPKAG